MLRDLKIIENNKTEPVIIIDSNFTLYIKVNGGSDIKLYTSVDGENYFPVDDVITITDEDNIYVVNATRGLNVYFTSSSNIIEAKILY